VFLKRHTLTSVNRAVCEHYICCRTALLWYLAADIYLLVAVISSSDNGGVCLRIKLQTREKSCCGIGCSVWSSV